MQARDAGSKAITDRQGEILRLILRNYIVSGEPVGSRTLSDELGRRLSPATVRNIMAELEDTGYLTHPHTSAGRVPTEQAYRYYVDHLADRGKVSRSDQRIINQALAESESPEDLMARASMVLSSLSKHVGVVFAPPEASAKLKHIEFLDLMDGKVLVIFVSKTGHLERRLIRVPESYSQRDLDRAGRYLVEQFSGLTLLQIRDELLRRMEEERSVFDRMASLLRTWSDSVVEDAQSARAVYVEGTSSIFDQPEFSDLEQLKNLFKMFEEKHLLVKLLNECIAGAPTAGIRIAIGSELGIPEIQNLTMISSSYSGENRVNGCVAVFGPTRMSYERGITLVGYVADVFGRKISG